MPPLSPPARSRFRLLCAVLCAGSFVLVIHNYALSILPRTYLPIAPSAIGRDLAPEATFTYVFPFDRSTPDRPYQTSSRAILFENGSPQAIHLEPALVRATGSGYWAHEPGRILFAASDNSDPRTNGRRYGISYPILYFPALGRAALLGLALTLLGLHLLAPPRTADQTPAAASGRRRAHLIGAAALFLTGLYFSTGTLAPYANTTIPHVAKGTGYLYNPDHIHLQALFRFVDGQDRATWDGALFLRRILYNVLAYPFMKAAGWEVGGTLASLGFNLAAFVIFVLGLQRRVGERGAAFGAWTLALYPGAAYWAGLPYFYALIVPGSLLLMLVLLRLADGPGWRPVLLCSLGLGLANLGYDFFIFFLPASLLILAAQRRWAAAGVSFLLQLAPLAAWTLVLRLLLGQTLVNSNSASFGAVAGSYLHLHDLARWWLLVQSAPELLARLFFGANFLFLPALFLGVVALNAWRPRVRLQAAEAALLAAGLAFFLFNNLAPDYSAPWQMRGTWIARLYQPVFPALIWFCARWYERSAGTRPWRMAAWTLAGLAAAGNALVLFGPALMNPLHLSETAFYRFYDHANPLNYESNLRIHGRRPLGFVRPQPR